MVFLTISFLDVLICYLEGEMSRRLDFCSSCGVCWPEQCGNIEFFCGSVALSSY